MGKKKLLILSAVMMALSLFVLAGTKSGSISYANSGVYYAASAKDNRTGVYKAKYTMNGKTTTEWCYLKNGKVQYSYTGFASNESGWWYVEKGKVTFKKNDVIQGTVKGQKAWWFVKESKVQFVDSVEKNSSGWWCIQKGKVNFNYTGFAKNSLGWWYCKGGKVDFSKNDVMKGTVNGQTGYWFVSGGQVKFIDSVEKNSAGWWCIRKGKVDFNYTGFTKNSLGWWYCKGGKVDFSKKDVMKGIVNGQTGYWLVSGGQVKLIDSVEKNSSGWWKITKGMVDFKYNGLAKNSSGWWYCEFGKVRFDLKGIVYDKLDGKYDSWYVKDGKVQTGFSGNISTDDYDITIKNGRVVSVNVKQDATYMWVDVKTIRELNNNQGHTLGLQAYDASKEQIFGSDGKMSYEQTQDSKGGRTYNEYSNGELFYSQYSLQETSNYSMIEKRYDLTNGKTLSYTWTQKYDSEWNLLSSEWIYSSGNYSKTEYTYNAKGQLILTEESSNRNGVKETSKTESKYDAIGNCVEEKTTDNYGHIFTTYKEYDKNGVMISRKEYMNGNMSFKSIYTYENNSDGKTKKSTYENRSYFATGDNVGKEAWSEKYTSVYDYDEKGVVKSERIDTVRSNEDNVTTIRTYNMFGVEVENTSTGTVKKEQFTKVYRITQ